LQALAAWTLSGRFAVAAGNEGFSGGLEWQQRGSHAELALRGPMGGEAIRMHVDGADYVVETPDGASYDGERAQRLLAERIGAVRPLPVQDMRYWLLGVPAPATPHEETLGTDQRLASLNQSGWLIRYGGFETVGALVAAATDRDDDAGTPTARRGDGLATAAMSDEAWPAPAKLNLFLHCDRSPAGRVSRDTDRLPAHRSFGQPAFHAARGPRDPAR
jgi:outer membrane biogenesis lipoprotein LolB